MPNLPPDLEKVALLRQDAEYRLRQGAAPPTHGWLVGADALTLLYRLASTPDTAVDALKLLSELQTYQVELDLQHDQHEADQREQAQALAHYQALYELAPVGYLVVGLDGRICEGNSAGAELLGTGAGGLAGQPIGRFFAQHSRAVVLGLVERLRDGVATVRCAVEGNNRGGGPEPLRISARLAPGGEAVLMVLSRRGPLPV